MDLNEILSRSKAVMDRTKDAPRRHMEREDIAASYEMTDGMNSRDTSSAPMFNESIASKSQLPKAVIDMMRNTAEEQINSGASVLDTMNISLPQPKPQKKQQVVKENTVPQVSSSVDYSLIKMIVEEAMKKYTTSLKKSMLQEGQGSGLQLMTKKGNTFRFVTEDGKIFEGKLEYKGKLDN